ncbi:hypothetical protein Mfla_0566 [Methylobacillus flagellatus KT]|uniref:Uncharacterized protein n=1 Tax=Methylobacillus flagellatus (strain ATCC 51484 / DSM 6875 / VKM B-1610 / KT) TaxID=265072 RepID=Q1H3V1_METFK|nr:hypothetical protein Mfla_0566 [Methylobacillus flagellatus KT]
MSQVADVSAWLFQYPDEGAYQAISTHSQTILKMARNAFTTQFTAAVKAPPQPVTELLRERLLLSPCRSAYSFAMGQRNQPTKYCRLVSSTDQSCSHQSPMPGQSMKTSTLNPTRSWERLIPHG